MIAAHDPFGNAIWVQRATSVAAVAGFVDGFLGYRPSILAVLAAAEHDDSLIVQACAAALQLFSESPSGFPRARAHLARAANAALPSTERERLFASAIQAWARGDLATALAHHATLAQQHPRDLASVKLGQYHAFNLGDTPTLLRLALWAAPAADDIPWLHGLLAFGHEQTHGLDAAEAAARRGLAMRPDEPWAQHALAHVMLTDGRVAEGAAFMRQASPQWAGLTSFMRCHNWWHLALFEIELGAEAAALRLYDEQVWGVDKTYSQDQIGAVSLLARLALVGVDVGPRWQDLAPFLAQRLSDQVQPFLDLQYLYGLARAGHPGADTLQAHIEDFAATAPALTRSAWQQVAVPAGRGLLAHARSHWAEAARALASAMPHLAALGGSHAQRDLFEQIYLDALQRSGSGGVAALNLLAPQARSQPQSLRLARQLAALRERLGLPVLR